MMSIDDHMPEFPPLGDVSTVIGCFRLVAERIKQEIDEELRFKYPLCTDTVEIYMEGFIQLTTQHPELVQESLLSILKSTVDVMMSCNNPECAVSGNHELMEDIIRLIRDTPRKMFDELRNEKGILPGFSMN